MAVTLYGFKSCDTVKKARTWLADHKVSHTFFDYRVATLEAKTVDDWFQRAGWEAVFNRNSTAFKEMPVAAREGLTKAKAKSLLLAETNLIKRPVLDTGDHLVFGFKPAVYAEIFGTR